MAERRRSKKEMEEVEPIDAVEPIEDGDEKTPEELDAEANDQADAYVSMSTMSFAETNEMVTEIERLKQTIRDLRVENDGLKQRIFQMQGEIQRIKNPAMRGVAGYIVETPRPFSGVFAGVVFKEGRAFIPEYQSHIANMMRDDFGYRVTKTLNYIP